MGSNVSKPRQKAVADKDRAQIMVALYAIPNDFWV
jgi:hypothetical protein